MALQSYASQLLDRISRESGQTMAEYAVVLTVITAAVVSAVALLSTNVGSLISSVASMVVGS